MGSRGRTSAAELSVISGGGVETIRRPEPPRDLTDEEAEVWRTVVNRLPADWFPAETLPMLAQYARHTIASKRVASMIEQLDLAVAADIKDGTTPAAAVLGTAKMLDRLLKMQERESRCIASLATKMRISQQTTYDKSRKKGSVGPKKPWEA
jgi:hypothetical protein